MTLIQGLGVKPGVPSCHAGHAQVALGQVQKVLQNAGNCHLISCVLCIGMHGNHAAPMLKGNAAMRIKALPDNIAVHVLLLPTMQGSIVGDMAHFIVVYMVLVAMLSVALVTSAGQRIAPISSFTDALLNLLQYTLFGDPVGAETLQVGVGESRISKVMQHMQSKVRIVLLVAVWCRAQVASCTVISMCRHATAVSQ
jgi:hypothetical protein